jgi:hypothetical protein
MAHRPGKESEMTNQINETEWVAGYEAFLDGSDASESQSPSFRDGFEAARVNQADDVAVAERDCIADYDANAGWRARA